MSGLLLLSGLALAGATVVWWIRRRSLRSATIRPVPVPARDREDTLPGGEETDGQNGLAVFYAYQMAASRINRS
jgi:hypothetical protein